MTQQTIGNTVYTVGQKIEGYNDGGPLFEYMRQRPSVAFYSNLQHGSPYSIGSLKYTDFPIYVITLPYPDPVEDEWREVKLPDFRENQEHIYSEFEALQLAMQEVCEADEVKLEWAEFVPEDAKQYQDKPAGLELSSQGVVAAITCLLLGGKVSVKGGV